jgi:predicted ester cyclase
MVSTEDAKAVVARMVERSMISGDLDAALNAYAPHFAYHNPVLRDLPPFPHPADAIRQLTSATRDAFPDMAYVIEAVVAEDDLVAVLYTWSGTNLGVLAGLPPTGRRVTATGAIVCRVADRRIVEQWDIDDRLDVIQQLGLFPTSGARPS